VKSDPALLEHREGIADRQAGRRLRFWMVVGLAMAAYLCSFLSLVQNEHSDPLGSLLTAQAIIETGTPWLDSYHDRRTDDGYYHDGMGSGRRLYGFPVGTSFCAVPFVWVANVGGLDMNTVEGERTVQNLLSAMAVSGMALLAFYLARCFLCFSMSWIVAFVFTFGTTLISTCGTALWSHNLQLVFVLTALLQIARFERRGNPVCPVLFAVALFMAYLCRPTAAPFGALAFLYLLCRLPRRGVVCALVLGILTVLFAAYSWRFYGTLLPPYYLPKRIAGSQSFFLALYGNLVSPSRGIFVFNPVLLPVLLLLAAVPWRKWRGEIVAVGVLGLAVLHIVIISRFPHWWGGHSYGSRLALDVLPFVLYAVVAVGQAAVGMGRWGRGGLAVLFVLASLAGIGINTGQGLFNRATAAWNAGPNVDSYPASIFNWRFPQFLATGNRLDLRGILHGVARFEPVSGQILPASRNVFYDNWHVDQIDGNGASVRWSAGTVSSIFFRFRERAHDVPVSLAITAGTFGRQRVEIRLNGNLCGSYTHDGYAPTTHTFALKPGWLRANDINIIEVRTPGAPAMALKRKGAFDARGLGICLHRLQMN